MAKQAVNCRNVVRVKVWHTHTTVWLFKNYSQRILTYYMRILLLVVNTYNMRILLLDLTYGRTMISGNMMRTSVLWCALCTVIMHFQRVTVRLSCVCVKFFYGHPVAPPLYFATVVSSFFMVTLWNRADHYIFALVSSFFFLFFRRLISAVADWMSTILLHMVWP